MIDEQQDVDWSRVHHLRGCGMSAADALEQVKSESAEQAGPINQHPSPDAAAESKLTDKEHAAYHAKTCSPRSAVSWVAANLGTRPKLVDAPSPTAWNLYCWANASSVNRADFVRILWAKLIPSQTELANEDRFSDDSQWLLDKIEDMRAKYEEDAAEAERQRLLRVKAAQMNSSIL